MKGECLFPTPVAPHDPSLGSRCGERRELLTSLEVSAPVAARATYLRVISRRERLLPGPTQPAPGRGMRS